MKENRIAGFGLLFLAVVLWACSESIQGPDAGIGAAKVVADDDGSCPPAAECVGTSGNDVLKGILGTTTRISGRGGNDELRGFGAAMKVNGGSGDDELSGQNVFGGSGNDIIEASCTPGGVGEAACHGTISLAGRSWDVVLSGGGGSDHIADYGMRGYLDGGSGDDYLDGCNGDDYIQGGAGNDHIKGEQDNDELRGGPGEDFITGGIGNDLILGGSGNDTILPGYGNDNIRGGPGNDVFEFFEDTRATGDVDIIYDFGSGDKLDMNALGVNADNIKAAFASGGLEISLPNGSTVILKGVRRALTASDFQ